MTIGPFDAVLLLSFGGPEGPDDVVPFLENVTRGRGIPRERLEVVGAHYHLFGGVSPINEQNKALIAALEAELERRGHDVPVHWGNRNWAPYVGDTVDEMTAAGHQRVVALVTSAFSSYSGCRQYHDDIERALETRPDAPAIQRVRVFWNHPEFLGAVADRVVAELRSRDLDPHTLGDARFVFTAHSIPNAMAIACDYEAQLNEAAGLVMGLVRSAVEEAGEPATGFDVVYQSRSGPPQVPWLEPDVCDHLEAMAAGGVDTAIVVPIGFVSDHMEVIYDLDTQAAEVAERVGIDLVRVPTVGTHPRFVRMLVDLIEEQARLRDDRPALGAAGPRPDQCAPGCCPAPARPAGRPGRTLDTDE